MADQNDTLDPHLIKHMRDVARHLRDLDVSPRAARDILRTYAIGQDEDGSVSAAKASATAN